MLFQVHFLSLLLEERGAGDLAAVAEHVRQKLIRRHPHVFGETEDVARSATGQERPEADQPNQNAGQDAPRRGLSSGEVLQNWDRIKQDEPGREPSAHWELEPEVSDPRDGVPPP